MPAPPPESEPAMVTAIGVSLLALCRAGAPSSTTARIAFAAAVGSGASDSAEITDTPSAPAAIVAPALAALMPAMAHDGNFGSRCGRRRRCGASPSTPIGAFFWSFEVVA